MENTNLPKTYNPKDFESRLYSKWVEDGLFKSKPNPNNGLGVNGAGEDRFKCWVIFHFWKISEEKGNLVKFLMCVASWVNRNERPR